MQIMKRHTGSNTEESFGTILHHTKAVEALTGNSGSEPNRPLGLVGEPKFLPSASRRNFARPASSFA